MVRPLMVAALALALASGTARAATQEFRIVVVPGLTIADLRALAPRGAVGLLVPSNGPTTSSAQAGAALVRGKLRNSFLDGGVPRGARLVSVETASAPPASGPFIVLALPADGTQANERRYPVAVVGSGFHGLLTSTSTRLPGVVSIVDIAPTALRQEDSLRSSSSDDAAARVAELDRLIGAKGNARLYSTLVCCILVILLAVVFPRASILGCATGLTANVILGAAETASLWIVLTVLVGSIVLAAPIAHFVRSWVAIGATLAVVLVLYLAAMAIDAAWVAYSPWGPEQTGRFYGVTNLLETILLVPALAGAALLGRRYGPVAFAAVALLAFVTVAGSRFGADGGGAVVLAAGYAVLGCLLARIRGRALAAALVGAVAVAVGLVALDAATGGSSHVTNALGGGPGSLAAHLSDRLRISWDRVTVSPGPALTVALSLALLAAVVVRDLRSGAPLPERALPLAFAFAVAVSLVVNDAPNDVAAAGVMGYLVCSGVMLRGRCAAASCSRSPLAFSWLAAEERPLSRLRRRP